MGPKVPKTVYSDTFIKPCKQKNQFVVMNIGWIRLNLGLNSLELFSPAKRSKKGMRSIPKGPNRTSILLLYAQATKKTCFFVVHKGWIWVRSPNNHLITSPIKTSKRVTKRVQNRAIYPIGPILRLNCN